MGRERDWQEESLTETSVGHGAQASQRSLHTMSFGTFGTENLEQGVRRLLRVIVNLTTDVSRPQREYIELLGQLKILLPVSHELGNAAHKQNRGQLADPSQDHLWDSVRIISERCVRDTMDPLEEQLEQDWNFSQCRGPTPYQQELSRNATSLSKVLKALYYQTAVFSVLQKAINLGADRQTSRSDGSLEEAYERAAPIWHLASKLESELSQALPFYAEKHEEGIEDMHGALQKVLSMARGTPNKSVNKHWQVPRKSNRLYTGRRQQLQAISQAFATRGIGHRRFVIQGMPGSGKSDLALRYAEEHSNYYWGVFWLDASTRKNATESYSEIGKLGGVEPIERAAMNWLSHLHISYTWLLIIDNADDSELSLEDIIPPSVQGSAQGCILVTTRNPGNLEYGTTGRLELKEMNGTDANELLLRAADFDPWTSGPMDIARMVCKHLHYLPLALLHAGKAIKDGLCELAGYIDFFNSQASRIRMRRNKRRDRSTIRTQRRTIEDEEHMSIFGSYEILYESLEGAATRDHDGRFQNALQLLQVFSYMHFQNIRLDVIIHAATNPLVEEEARKAKEIEDDMILKRSGPVPKQSLTTQIQNLVIRIKRNRLLAPKPTLPDVLKNPDDLDTAELGKSVDYDLRTALKVLVDRGLLNRGVDREGIKRDQQRYHMHPLVHQWVRERPQTTMAEGALYCQMATTVLCRAIKLIAKDDDGEMAMRRDLKPHIDNVLHYTIKVNEYLEDNRRRRRVHAWSMLFGGGNTGLTPSRAEEFGRFSRVYLECGAFAEAEVLLKQVRSYLKARLGHDHLLTHRVKEALAAARWNLSFWNKSAKLIRQVYESRKKTLGPKHPATIDITNKLGMSVLSQGRITEAIGLHEDAKMALVDIYDEHHPEVYKTIGYLGRCYFYRMDWTLSVELHRKAASNLRGLWETDSAGELAELDVLHSEEDLAMGLIRLEKDDKSEQVPILDEALKLIHRVMDRRSAILGKEAPFTLVAKANYGRVLSKCGRFAEADELMRKTLETAETNHGEDHLAVLAGKCWYGQVLLENGILDRAETYFRQAMKMDHYKKAAHEDGEHPDRIMAVWLYVRCLKQQKRFDEALQLCAELETNIPQIGGKGYGTKHRFAELLPGIIKDIEEQKPLAEKSKLEQHVEGILPYIQAT